MSDLLSFVLGQGDQFRRQRLPSLYADFTLQRHSNPDGYAANTSAWIEALGKAARAGLLPADGDGRDTLSLRTGESLLRSLETKEWGRPLALGTVIDEAVSQRRMIPYEEFLSARKSIYNRTWTVQPWWLLSWALRKFGLFERSGNTGTLPIGRFVIVQNVEEAARKIIGQMGGKTNLTDQIHPMCLFRGEIAKILDMRERLTDSDLHIILTHLERDKSTIIYDSQTVKFRNVGETVSELSDQDQTVSTLKSLIAKINVQVEYLSTRIATLSENAQAAIKNKNRTSGLAAIKSKRLNETFLSQRTETLSHLQEIYGKIEQAADQITIVRVMKDSAAVLRDLHAQTGGVGEVEDVVVRLKDEMSKVDEIGSVLETAGQEDILLDESAIDVELEAMEMHIKIKEDEREALETQKLLASIDDVDKEAKVAKGQGPQQRTSAEAAATIGEEDMKALRHLSLDEGPAASTRKSGVSQPTQEQIPNVVPGD